MFLCWDCEKNVNWRFVLMFSLFLIWTVLGSHEKWVYEMMSLCQCVQGSGTVMVAVLLLLLERSLELCGVISSLELYMFILLY